MLLYGTNQQKISHPVDVFFQDEDSHSKQSSIVLPGFLFSYRLLMLIMSLKSVPCELIKMACSSGWNNEECPMDLFWPYEAVDTYRFLPLQPASHLLSYFFHCMPRTSHRFQHYSVNKSHWKWFCWEMSMSQFFVGNFKSRCLGLT